MKIKKSILDTINYPTYLKYNGEEEVLSLEFFTNNIDIYACPSSLYTKVGHDPILELYVPFSKNHNYNEALAILKNGQNLFTNVHNRPRSKEDFNKFHNDIFYKKSLIFIIFLVKRVAYYVKIHYI